MMNDTMKEIINDAKEFSLDCHNAALLRMGLMRISERLQALCDAGLYITPKGSVEECGKGAENAAEPRKIWRYCDMKSMPRGIEMKEFVHADGSLTFVGQYFRAGAPGGSKPKRCIYRVEVRKLAPLDDFAASVFEDDVRLVHLSNGKSKWTLVYAALGALRGILHKRCIQTNPNRRAKRKAKEGK